MKPNAIQKLEKAVELLNQAQQLVRESYLGDSAEEILETIGYAIEDIQTDIDLLKE